MKPNLKSLLILLFFLTLTAFTIKRIDYRDGRYKNVCKDLKNEVLLYFIFVDTKTTSPWSEFDIMSTIDSVHVAVKWLEKQSEKNQVKLKIKTDYYIGNEYATITRNLPQGTVQQSIKGSSFNKSMSDLNKWTDNISLKAGSSFFIKDKDGIPQQRNPKNTERLIAHLRDEYSVESVALLFMVNNYYRTDISYALNTLNTEFVEYAIVSYKYPSEIAHNFLHLYGAADLYLTPLRRSENKIKIADKYFSNDIMQDPYAKNIINLEISEYTKYLIGWTEKLDKKFEPLLTDKIANF